MCVKFTFHYGQIHIFGIVFLIDHKDTQEIIYEEENRIVGIS